MATTEEGSSSRKRGAESLGKPAEEAGTFAVSGEYWTLGYGGATFQLKDIKGLRYIQRLVRHPGEEFHALDLLSGSPGASIASESARIEKHESSLPIGVTFRPGLTDDSGEMLDAQAKENYKRELHRLSEELEELRERGDHERAEQIESNIEFLKREIMRAVGIGGRDRRAGSAAERARLNVTRAIKTALQRISRHRASMGELLDRSIKTGSFCSYAPHPSIHMTWRFSVERSDPPDEAAAAEPIFSRRETSFLGAFTGGTIFVGREAERDILSRCLAHALNGEGRMVLIGGAAGVGKTRIGAEVGAEASRRGMRAFVGGCYDRDDPVPFIPFVEILEEALAQTRDLTAFREALGNDAPEMARLLPQLRRLFPDIPPPLELPPEQARRILFGAVSDFVARVARNTPTLFLLDDLHWADQGTLLLLNHIAQLVPKMPVLVVGTYRDFDLNPAGQLTRTLDELIRRHLVERITLEGLSRSAVAEMLRALSGRAPPDSVVDLFYSETEGNPFFVEELFRHLVEQGKLLDSDGQFRRDIKLGDDDVPASLRLVIGRRLARLSDSTATTLGTAAVIGRSFTFELLAASTQVDPDSLLDCVEEAERAGLISSTVQYPEARFRFSHELIRQAVISRVSVARRQRLHLSVAAAIEGLHANTLEDVANELAHHLLQAGTSADADKTARFLAMAAKRLLEQGAYDDGIRHLYSALELTERLAPGAERDRKELELRLVLGRSLAIVKGWAAAELEPVYARARELCAQIRDPALAFRTLYGQWLMRFWKLELHDALEVADELLATAEDVKEPAMLLTGNLARGAILLELGELVSATDHLAKALAVFDVRQPLPAELEARRLLSFNYLYFGLSRLGYPDRAWAKSREMLEVAQRSSDPFILAHASCYAASHHLVRGDGTAAQKRAEEAMALAEERGFVSFLAMATIVHGGSLITQGRHEEGIAGMRRGISALRATGGEPRAWYLCLLASDLGRIGRPQEGLQVVEEGFASVAKTGQLNSPSLHYVKGRLLLAQDPSDGAEAEQSFRTAIEIARRQNARAEELRATTSLARLLAKQGRRDEARTMLAAIYGWFTEGFDTHDLKDAKALLDQLNA